MGRIRSYIALIFLVFVMAVFSVCYDRYYGTSSNAIVMPEGYGENSVSIETDTTYEQIRWHSMWTSGGLKQPVEIVISAAGDCTLGSDTSFGYTRSFIDVVTRNGMDFPMKNVESIFKSDDITVVNLETTLTNEEKRAEKEFKFKGKPEYTGILKIASVEAVNIANNHTKDYLEKGYIDTLNNLTSEGIGYFGNGNRYIKEVKGIKVGFLGYKGWSNSRKAKNTIKKEIEELKMECRIVVVSFHWGIERENYPNSVQTDLGHFAIDCGADLVIGHHPHVIQGIEEYKGKHILYSLGNFSYGGHKNPADKDTYIFREKFSASEDEVNIVNTEVIPCSISSIKNYNNFQPTPLTDSEGIRILDRLSKYSSTLKYGYNIKTDLADTSVSN